MGYQNEVPIKDLQTELKQFYGIEVQVQTTPLPASAYYAPRGRYRADSILNYLKRSYPGKRVIAITSKDISTSIYGVKDYGIFGLGHLIDGVSITSTYRLKSKNLKDRLTKVLLHEVGHSFGLPHCNSKLPCLMNAGNHTAAGIDREPKALCKDCKLKKQSVYVQKPH